MSTPGANMHFFKIVGFILVTSITVSRSQGPVPPQHVQYCNIYGITTKPNKFKAALQYNVDAENATVTMSSGRVTWELNQQWNICTNGTSLLTTISTIRANYDTGEKFMVTPDGTSIKLLPHGLSNAAHFNGSKVDDNWLYTFADTNNRLTWNVDLSVFGSSAGNGTENQLWRLVKIPELARKRTLLAGDVQGMKDNCGKDPSDIVAASQCAAFERHFNGVWKLYELFDFSDHGEEYE